MTFIDSPKYDSSAYYPQQQSDSIGCPKTPRRSKIYYANNDTVPPEKRGKEISDEDYEKIANTRLGNVKALKAPSSAAIKKGWKEFQEWAVRYMEKPHRYNVDTIEKNTNTVLDIIDGTKKVVHQTNAQSPDGQPNIRLTA